MDRIRGLVHLLLADSPIVDLSEKWMETEYPSWHCVQKFWENGSGKSVMVLYENV